MSSNNDAFFIQPAMTAMVTVSDTNGGWADDALNVDELKLPEQR